MSIWDMNHDGEVNGVERFIRDEMLCASKEEHERMFGYAGNWGDVIDEDEELEDNLILAGLDPFELEMMDEDERREAFEDAGLDSDDYGDF